MPEAQLLCDAARAENLSFLRNECEVEGRIMVDVHLAFGRDSVICFSEVISVVIDQALDEPDVGCTLFDQGEVRVRGRHLFWKVISVSRRNGAPESKALLIFE